MLERRIRQRVLCLLGVPVVLVSAARATSVAASLGSRSDMTHGTDAPLVERWYSKPAETEPSGADAAARASTAAAELLAHDALAAGPKAGLEARGMAQDAAPPPTYETPNHPALSDRFFFGIGAYFASATTEARLDSSSGLGTTIGFEDLLGLDNSDITPQGLFRWRMSDRWRLELEYFELNRSNTLATTQDITWGDTTIPSGTQITAQYDVSVTRLSAGYSFFKRPDKEIGIALGFHVTNIKAELATTGGTGDDGKVLAPLPVISLYGQFALTDTWAISTRLDAFRLSYKPYEGHVYSLGLDTIYQPWRNVGIGLGYRSLEMEFSASNNDWEGAFRSNFSGPIAFVAFSF